MASLSLGRLPWYGQIGVFVALLAAGVGGFSHYYESPRQEVIAGRQRELATIQARINDGRAKARQLPEFRKQIGDLETRLESLKPILPEQKDVGDLLRRIQRLATQSKLIIRGFRPQAIATREMHAEWPISLEFEGTYHSLGMFLDRVSKFPRIINVGALVMTQQDPPTSNVTMKINCTATTFVLVEASTAAAAKKGGAGLAFAQTPTPAPAPETAAAPEAAPAVALPSPPADFVYSIEGRRDPFVSLLKRGADPGVSQGKRAEGAAGLQTGEIAVRGIVLNRGAWAAIVAGPDGKVYTVRAGDHLLDGTVRNITAQYVAVLQEVKDPLSVEKQREVRKYLRGGEEVK